MVILTFKRGVILASFMPAFAPNVKVFAGHRSGRGPLQIQLENVACLRIDFNQLKPKLFGRIGLTGEKEIAVGEVCGLDRFVFQGFSP
jgi:hypothetical protein